MEAQRCDVKTLEGCSEKEQAFLGKQKDKDAAGLEKELARLTGMEGGKMKPDLLVWLQKRINLLRKLKDEL